MTTKKIDLEDKEIILLCKALQTKIKTTRKWAEVDKNKENKFYYNRDLTEIREYQDLLNKFYKVLPEGSFVLKK